MVRTTGIRSDFEVYDRRFLYLLPGNTWVERLFTGCLWAEGPAYFADADCLIWSDIPNDRMLRWVDGHIGVFRQPSHKSNGNTRDRQGRLVSCEHGSRRVTRTEPDGSITVLADRFEGKRLNSPNDVVVKSDDTVWFSDPPYGILHHYEGYEIAESDYGHAFVFRADFANQTIEPVATDFVKPNGLAFSPDESKLYVSDTGSSHDHDGPHHVRVFSVEQGRTLHGGEVFAEISPGAPDGFRVDEQGNLWISAGDGVHCYSADGVCLGKIKVPEPVANVTFGGPKRNRLFITATTSLYAVYLAVRGVQRP